MRKVVGTLMIAGALMLVSCASTPKASVEKAADFAVLQDKAIELNHQGMIAAVGIGNDPDGDYGIALSKAILDGQVQVAAAFSNQIGALTKNYVGKTGDSDPKVATDFEQAQRSTVNKTLTGVTQLTSARQITEGKAIRVGIIMGIDQKMVNKSFLDELKGTDSSLYDRFRASEAFKELDKAIGDQAKPQ